MWRPSQKDVSETRWGKISAESSLFFHSKLELKDCLEVICEYNPRFPEKGTLDEELQE
jgi:hypothetical protein